MASHTVKVSRLAAVRLQEPIVLLMLTPARAEPSEGCLCPLHPDADRLEKLGSLQDDYKYLMGTNLTL